MDAPLHFKVEAYEDRGNHPWYVQLPPPPPRGRALICSSPSSIVATRVRKHYELDVPRTATVREALALFRANGAPSWMSDQTLAEGTVPRDKPVQEG